MKFVKKWATTVIILILLVFLTVEIAFFITNVAKIKQRWMFLVFEIALVFIMYVWFKARKITNRFLQFDSINNYIPKLLSLSEDLAEPKYARHLVYLTKANNQRSIEKRIIESILYKKPKRADVYWLIHIDRSDEPYMMEYSINQLVKDKIIRIDFKLGFRIQPRINLYFRKVLNEMIDQQELNLQITGPDLHKRNIDSDIRFVLIEKFLSIENEFSLREGFILNSYFSINRMAQSNKKAFGLDLYDTVIEQLPLVVAPIHQMPLIRKKVN